jgi:hypothetical protein
MHSGNRCKDGWSQKAPDFFLFFVYLQYNRLFSTRPKVIVAGKISKNIASLVDIDSRLCILFGKIVGTKLQLKKKLNSSCKLWNTILF